MFLAIFVLLVWVQYLLLSILNQRLTPRLRCDGFDANRAPFVSLIIPARDEERAIETTLRAALEQRYPRFEVLVVDDGSTDRTGAIASRLAEKDPRLQVIVGKEPPPGWLGKPWALQQGAHAARGELLLFLDADIVYHRDTLAAAVAFMAVNDVGLVAFIPRFEVRGFWEHVVIPGIGLLMYSALPIWLANRSRSPKLAFGGGPGNLVRRSVYERAGGHEAVRNAVVDDIALARAARRVAPTVAVRAEHLVSVRMYHGLGEIVRGFTKNAWSFLGLGSLPAALSVLALIGVVHVMPYVWALAGAADLASGSVPGAFGLIGLVIVVLIAATRLVIFLPLRWGLANAVFADPLMGAVWCVILARSIWTVGLRRRLGWRGRTYRAAGREWS